MAAITSKPDYGIRLIGGDGEATDRLQLYFDDITQCFNDFLLGTQVTLPPYTVDTLPPVLAARGLISVLDEIGGEVPAFSDGTNWRRVTDRAIVS